MTLIGRLAQASGATVLLASAERQALGHGYVIRVAPLLLDFSQPVTQQVNNALEQVIRTCPSQYLWSYNRYKVPRGVQSPEPFEEQTC